MSTLLPTSPFPLELTKDISQHVGPTNAAARDSMCWICRVTVKEDETLWKHNTCGNAWHISCTQDWLDGHCSCPCCRECVKAHVVHDGQQVVVPYEVEEFEEGSEESEEEVEAQEPGEVVFSLRLEYQVADSSDEEEGNEEDSDAPIGAYYCAEHESWNLYWEERGYRYEDEPTIIDTHPGYAEQDDFYWAVSEARETRAQEWAAIDELKLQTQDEISTRNEQIQTAILSMRQAHAAEFEERKAAITNIFEVQALKLKMEKELEVMESDVRPKCELENKKQEKETRKTVGNRLLEAAAEYHVEVERAKATMKIERARDPRRREWSEDPPGVPVDDDDEVVRINDWR